MVDENFLAQRRAHAPQLAGSEVAHRVEVVITANHRKEPASWGCHVAACCAPRILRNYLSRCALIQSGSLLQSTIATTKASESLNS